MSSSTVRRGKPARDWRERFLRNYVRFANVRDACEAAGVSRSLFYRERARNAAFDAQVLDAADEAADRIEHEAWRRAVEGETRVRVETTTDAKGRTITKRIEETVKSDTLLIFKLKALRPEKYRDNYDLGRIVGDLASQAEPVDRDADSS